MGNNNLVGGIPTPLKNMKAKWEYIVTHISNHHDGDYRNWLVVSTPLKNMTSSVGIIIPNMMGKSKKNMFQTTNQSYRQDWTYHTNDSKCEYITVSSGDLTFLHLFWVKKT